MSLPRDSHHCVNSPSLQTINYSTDPWGGRIFASASPSHVKTTVFGESQALGMDTNDLPVLYQQLGVESAVIYAAPNNGPYESYQRVAKSDYQKSDQYLMVINLGFDLFRLGQDWDPKRNNSNSLVQAESLSDSPRLTTINNLWRSLRGEAVGLSGDDRTDKLNLYVKHRQDILKNLSKYLETFHPNTVLRLGHLQTVLLMPYWLENLSEQTQLKNHIQQSICASGVHDSNFVWAYLPFDTKNVTQDKRHYKSAVPFKIEPLAECAS